MSYAFIDFSSIAHAIWYTVAKDNPMALSNGKLHSSVWDTLVERTTIKIRSDLKQTGRPEPVIVLDNFAAFKSDLYPQYKMNRNDIKPAIKGMADWAKRAGIGSVCESPDNEADDAIATLCKRNPKNSVVISADRDMWQLLDNDVQVYCPIKKRFITYHDVNDSFFGLLPKYIPLFKTCWGDAGDNVPNLLPRMQRQLLPLIKNGDGSFAGFHKSVKQGWHSLSQRCRDLYFAAEDQLEINYQLVKLRTDCEIIWH